MEKSEIINYLGSEELYEELKKFVNNELNEEIESRGLITHFEGTNVYEQFADFYIQGWINYDAYWLEEINEEWNKKIESNPDIIFQLKDLKLQRFKNEFFNGVKILVESDPIKFGITRRWTKSVIKGNTGFKSPISGLPKDEIYDFDVNSEQIAIMDIEFQPCIFAYFPDKEYPEGTLRSKLIKNVKKQFHQLWQKHGGLQADFIKRVLGIPDENKDYPNKE